MCQRNQMQAYSSKEILQFEEVNQEKKMKEKGNQTKIIQIIKTDENKKQTQSQTFFAGTWAGQARPPPCGIL